MRCLVVEDSLLNSELAVTVLQSAGHHVDVAHKGAAFRAAVDHGPCPDIVLMDLLLPDSNGAEWLAQLRASGRFAGVPVVALTGKGVSGDKERLEAAGFSAVLTNPINTRTFAAEVAHLAGAALRTTWVG